MDWLSNVFDFDVEKNEIPRTRGRSYRAHTVEGLSIVLHTTEGDTVAGALAALGGKGVPSHFTVGQGRIVQLRPINAQAAALHENPPHNPNDGTIQIEMVARSQQKPWLPNDETLKPAVALLAFLNRELGIPLTVPNGWPDDCSDIKTIWASNNTRRLQAEHTWPAPQGVWQHMEVPWQQPSWHYDCGAIRRTEMIAMANALLAEEPA